jgi:hypothetical protein
MRTEEVETKIRKKERKKKKDTNHCRWPDYIDKSNGHIRCVVCVTVEYRPLRRRINDASPVGVVLDVFHCTDEADSWDSSFLVRQLDVRSAVAADPDARLNLTLGDLHHALAETSTPVSVPLGPLLAALDDSYGGLAATPVFDRGFRPQINNGVGKRKRDRTPTSDPSRKEGAQ